MSEENVEAVRESYQTPGALFATWAERMAPKIEFDFTEVYPDRPVMRGIEELRRFREEGPWAELSFEPERFVDVDDERVLVLVRVHAKGTAEWRTGRAPKRSRVHHSRWRAGSVQGLRRPR